LFIKIIVMKRFFTLFAAMCLVVALNAQNVDYQLLGFVDNGDQPSLIEELRIGMNEDLTVNLAIVNNGPDELASGDSLKCTISVNGLSLAQGGYSYAQLSQYELLTVGSAWVAQLGLFNASVMDAYPQYFGNEFDLCITLSNNIATDSDPSNNTSCIRVYRGDVGVEDFVSDVIKVYPNPATDVINVANAEGAQISVFDISGRRICFVERASANESIDASAIAKGMYIVRIVDGKNNITTKKVSVVR